MVFNSVSGGLKSDRKTIMASINMDSGYVVSTLFIAKTGFYAAKLVNLQDKYYYCTTINQNT